MMSRMVLTHRRNILRNLPVAAAEQCNQFAIKINVFEGREEVVPVTLRFTVVPGWDAEQQNVITFEVFFAAFAMS